METNWRTNIGGGREKWLANSPLWQIYSDTTRLKRVELSRVAISQPLGTNQVSVMGICEHSALYHVANDDCQCTGNT